MSRRKRRHTLSPIALGQTILTIGSLTLIANAASQITTSFMVWIFLLTAIAFISIIYLRSVRMNRLTKKITETTNTNIDALIRECTKLLQQDAYGTWNHNPWHKEINRFITTKVIPILEEHEAKMLNSQHREWVNHIDHMVRTAKKHRPAFRDFSVEMAPSEFELFCAEQLRIVGWDARVTKFSRDQGADVIAQKGRKRLVLQCKFYSHPVGNKAVQEVVAARTHERADFCAVVSNRGYTVPAKQLASTTRAMLLHYSDLRNIDSIIHESQHSAT